ncbi:ABC transporter ATP-binding protein [Parasporobacterium paucivorans]|uniref:Sulfonate transport system ATP-binding protein n=1 Tax=Parasporobacterium paucivorans DSM 15970 TaxID=1122934 RepID=A0A1M6E0F7_9FIRM|nr:ABC transporter ATP-binding protein [Parasporobacterium paucivorans]SHI78883.1 sulfonate transport system ATP-binding protein [Parasporobacterium paucivorans DSM 15970]
MSEANLVLRDINKSFIVDKEKVEILKGINLDVKRGEIISIVGHSGCGKSTLLKIVAGLMGYDSGDLELEGRHISGPDTDRGMIFQEHRLFPWLTIKDNVCLGLNKMQKDEKYKLAYEYLELVKLKGFENAYPHQLSGGMSQRAAIARALVNRPGILLLDEPFGALDALTKIQLQQEVLRIWEKEKTTMILVTHDIDEAIYLGDRIVVMSSRPGTIEEIIPVELPRPRDRGSSDFAYIKKRVYNHFFKDVEIISDYVI